MLSVIKDRVDNADVYEREYFSIYPNYGYSRRKEKNYEQLHQMQA
jgi:hypothetical protein